MRYFVSLLALLYWLIPTPPLALAVVMQTASQLEIRDLRVNFLFGQQVQFEAWLFPAEEAQSVYLMVQPFGNSAWVEALSINPDGYFLYEHDLAKRPIPPFSPVEYWLRVTTRDGQTLESQRQVFLYEDNRFEWQSIESSGLVVKWYAGDLAFGQQAADVAELGVDKARELINANPPDPLRLYVYPTAEDLQAALAILNTSWVAGHASPEFSTVLISITPGPSQRLEMERQLPHEIAHILLYQAYGKKSTRFPHWFHEGLASLSELYPNSEYARALQKASQSNTLLPMESLCSGFPREASSAYLAYAQSESFARFLGQKFGNSSLQQLAQAYADGVDCLQGIQNVYNTSFSQLEMRWKQEYLGMDSAYLAWQSLLPYLVLMLAILTPLTAGGILLWRKK